MCNCVHLNDLQDTIVMHSHYGDSRYNSAFGFYIMEDPIFIVLCDAYSVCNELRG